MKKLLATIVLITCILGLTACGSSDEAMSETEKSAYFNAAGSCYMLMIANSDEEIRDDLRDLTDREWENWLGNFESSGLYMDGSTFMAGLESWWSAEEDLGELAASEDELLLYFYMGSIDTSGYEITESTKTISVNIPVEGTKHDAYVEVTFDKNMNVTGIATNIQYSFGEKMANAGLNTLLGMGTVFIMLILISLIISCFALIPKLQEKLSKKASKEEVRSSAVENTVAQIAEREEVELADDLELIAVISAAIAACEGRTSTDGFVVRSIKRANRR